MEMSREALLRAIWRVLPAMAKKELFYQANKIAFAGRKVAAFNDAVAIFHPLPGDLSIDGVVDGKRLYDLLGRLSGGIVQVVVDDNKLGLRAGRSRALFDILPLSLPIDSVDMTGELVDLPETFVKHLRWVGSSCAREMARPALTCVLVAGGMMQASDGYRASRIKHGGVELPRLMLPISQVEVLVEYDIKQVALSDGGEWARFTTEDETVVCTRSMAGVFPDLGPLCAMTGREVQLTGLLSPAIARARIFSKGNGNPIDEEIELTMRQNQIEVSAQCDGGQFSEIVQCIGSVEGVGFSIHPKFLDAALESDTRCIIGDRAVKFSGDGWDHIVALRNPH